jgi:hypothetical protein
VFTDDVRVAIYQSFRDAGRAPSTAEIAHAVGGGEDRVAEALQDLHDQDVIALYPGTSSIWLAHPFSSAAEPFHVETEKATWDAICIWDALGILALVGSDGGVTTSCPDCGETLRVDIVNGEVIGPDVVHYGVPAARWYEDVAYT